MWRRIKGTNKCREMMKIVEGLRNFCGIFQEMSLRVSANFSLRRFAALLIVWKFSLLLRKEILEKFTELFCRPGGNFVGKIRDIQGILKAESGLQPLFQPNPTSSQIVLNGFPFRESIFILVPKKIWLSSELSWELWLSLQYVNK